MLIAVTVAILVAAALIAQPPTIPPGPAAAEAVQDLAGDPGTCTGGMCQAVTPRGAAPAGERRAKG
jgi:hypothetical protein